jgi:hypothetical protein
MYYSTNFDGSDILSDSDCDSITNVYEDDEENHPVPIIEVQINSGTIIRIHYPNNIQFRIIRPTSNITRNEMCDIYSNCLRSSPILVYNSFTGEYISNVREVWSEVVSSATSTTEDSTEYDDLYSDMSSETYSEDIEDNILPVDIYLSNPVVNTSPNGIDTTTDQDWDSLLAIPPPPPLIRSSAYHPPVSHDLLPWDAPENDPSPDGFTLEPLEPINSSIDEIPIPEGSMPSADFADIPMLMRNPTIHLMDLLEHSTPSNLTTAIDLMGTYYST